ncbi:LysE family translocator [Halovivax sp.]|uniref:LysE family translocator n=1 Tax=Halovivax sp. TaxID=1935978 RepID=UPI0025C0BEDA|nr:LysE family transporter [Halovivax sp.]
MFEHAGTLVVGAVFGLALAAPPGPMNAIIAEESVLRGWFPGVTAGLGAMAADALFCALALVGAVAVLDEWGAIRPLLYLAGGALMCYFAVGAVRGAREATAAGAADASGVATGFRKTFLLSVTNPYQIGFWMTVGVGLLRPGRLDVFSHVPVVDGPLAGSLVVETGSPALLAGFFGGIGLWVLAYPAALVGAGRRVDAVAPLVAGASAAVLAGFGVLFLAIGGAQVL